jgi:hypothetical protein
MTPQLIIEKPFRVVWMKISTNVSIECIDAAPLVMWNIDFGAVRVSVSETKLRFILYLIHRLVVFWYTKIMVFSLVLV